MQSFIQPIAELFRQHAQQEKAAWSKSYLRNQFEFFGLPNPLRKALVKNYLKAGLPPKKTLFVLLKELWSLEQREFQYFGFELSAAFASQWDERMIHTIVFMLLHKSWWDSVDFVNSELSGPYFRLFSWQIRSVTGRWNHSANIWLQRSSIIFQKAYKNQTDTALLAEYILRLSDSGDFFVQKAIGWAPREYSKTDPDWVKKFVKWTPLPLLSKREALKRIKN